jgi:hypothetical protein
MPIHSVVRVTPDGIEVTEGTSNSIVLGNYVSVTDGNVAILSDSLTVGGVSITSAQISQLLELIQSTVV